MLCLVMASSLLPGSVLAAGQDATATYIVTLDVADGGEAIRAASRDARQRIRQRAVATRQATDGVVRDYDIQARQRYTTALSGFAARLTARQAGALARDARVQGVRQARVFRLSATSQVVPPGVRRVKAGPDNGTAPDVDVDIAIIDTGIGPVGGDELDVRGGINCTDDGLATDRWDDVYWGRHGTHVAGIAAARDNDRGVVGVAPGARLWAVRVFDSFGYGDEATVLCGLEWATRTVTGPAPEGSQPIEVINMSLEAPRLSFIEDCDALGASDPFHTAVCQATQAGITVVAAAGNAGTFSRDRKASSVVPGAYDQVITVGAINDYDGQGWGAGPRPASCSGGPDDAYAAYSNVGRDVDLLAPGTCVLSTLPDEAGTQPADPGSRTQAMSGTSQAAPHVTGAVARYLAANPGTAPEQMRRIVRAAGRLDWDIRSDPLWSGVSDTDSPNRVLDAAALLGPPDLRVWLSNERFRVAGTSTRRQVRVDVQRGGGYAGPADLTVGGLPATVGTAVFDRPGASLDGLTALGARLRLTLPLVGQQGPRTLSVTSSGPAANITGSRDLELLVDRKGPRVSALAARIKGGSAPLERDGAAPVVVSWDVSDAWSAVARVTPQRRIGDGTWRSIRGGSSRAQVSLAPARLSRFRVRSADALGNTSTSASLPVRLLVRDSSSAAVLTPAGGGWSTRRTAAARGGSLLVAEEVTESLDTTFRGSAVALLAPIGPQRGSLRLRVDEGPWQEVSLAHPKGRQQRIVHARVLEPGEHRLEIQGVSGVVAVDAILILE
jgi:hypothetical protein